MNKDELLSKMLKYSAMQNGLCSQWTNEWSEDCDLDALIDKYKRGLDFCIKHDWPAKEFVEDNFDKNELMKRHIYSGVEGFNDSCFSDVAAIVQHGSTGELHFSGYDAATVWVRHDSEVLITASGHAFVLVHVLDDAVVTVEQYGNSKVTVKKHGERASVVTTGAVKYIERKQ